MYHYPYNIVRGERERGEGLFAQTLCVKYELNISLKILIQHILKIRERMCVFFINIY